ncbi:MAG: BREX-3 system P-loop-containing protein BrxF [Anaerolineaceae bacterium]|jgi:hypothetical protein
MYFLQSIVEFESKASDCLILVHPTTKILEQAFEEFKQNENFPVIDIGKELSFYLLNITQTEQPRAIQKWIEGKVDESRPGPLFCIHIDFLFTPSFNLNPVTLFRQSARNSKLVVFWPGEYSSETLSYAVPEHRHYRVWHISDPMITICRLYD